MRLPRRVLIRLFIYIPLIGFLGWRAYDSRCGEPDTVQPEPPSLEDRLAPHRRVITLPDGKQQEIVELTPEEAEAILGRPLPEHMKDDGPSDGAGKAGSAPANDGNGADGTLPPSDGTAPANGAVGTAPANDGSASPSDGTAPAKGVAAGGSASADGAAQAAPDSGKAPAPAPADAGAAKASAD